MLCRLSAMKVPFEARLNRSCAGARTLSRRAGFTLLELLVVVGIVVLVIAALYPAFTSVRNRSAQAREMATARNLLTGWTSYATENSGALLPGYKTGLSAFDQNGKPIAESTIGVASARYPWRLAPYLSFNLRALYIDEGLQTLEALEQSDYSNYLYQTSVFPSLGLNTTWVGGDENQGGFNSAFQNAYGKFYVSRMTEIRNTAQLIVFASARGIDADPGQAGQLTQGYFRVRSPNFTSAQWAATYNDLDPASAGQLSSRHGGRTIIAMVDGHVETKQVDELRDMRFWADRASTPDWKLTPQTPTE
jgi:prepilin-type processing-associated H-X9-DG protein/prepilin-type N-terminal cleavage/methylation domain-containing protein